ncbi:SseB family protein [Glutamicibacter sp. PS]|uniref:SseB family protein n=1 Tax=Glutamicibacter sp. PS TaxID=3075634 RepID=UPI00283C5DFD|nr:SseB family protein [Glutamicibacter sp. PS]MDR4533335.1 SseB family protein [Glutamicibacter sp. PS]
MSSHNPEQTSQRHLPGHIAAALARAGEPSDSAGQSWEGRDLSGEGNPLHNFDQDDGLANPDVVAAIQALRAGTGDEAGVHAALANARVFVAVVAQLGEEAMTEHGFASDKEADMALVKIKAPDGRMALPIFTTVGDLQAWHPQARPVAVYAPRAALSAVSEEAQLLVMNPGSEFTFVLRRPGVWTLAKQVPWVPSYRDESLAELIGQAVAEHQMIDSVRLGPGRGVASRDRDGAVVGGGGVGPELNVQLVFRHGTPKELAEATARQIHTELAQDVHFAEAVDSMELSLMSTAH